GRDAVARHPGRGKRERYRIEHALPDLVGLMFHESRLGEVLRELARRSSEGDASGVHHERRGARGPLIDGKKQVGRHGGPPTATRGRGKGAADGGGGLPYGDWLGGTRKGNRIGGVPSSEGEPWRVGGPFVPNQ